MAFVTENKLGCKLRKVVLWVACDEAGDLLVPAAGDEIGTGNEDLIGDCFPSPVEGDVKLVTHEAGKGLCYPYFCTGLSPHLVVNADVVIEHPLVVSHLCDNYKPAEEKEGSA